MREIIDREILLLIEGLFNRLVTETSIFLNDAQALCAIFMLLYFGLKSYGMIAGDKRLELVSLLRPFALTLVIIFWPSFITIMNFPAEIITDKSKALVTDRIDEIDAIQLERRTKMAEIARKLIEDSAELEQFDNSDDDDWLAWTGVDFGKIFDEIKGYYIILLSKLRWVVVESLEFIVVSIFQACSYLIFFLQVIFAAILIILGPFSFAFSILPGFRDAYLTWMSRYISVSLYSGIGYIVMSLSLLLIRYGLEKELVLLDFVLKDEAAFFFYISSNDGSANFYLVSLIIGALAMLSIPVISTWIVSTSGIGNAVSTVFRGAQGMNSIK
ncbi:plasmid transfer protein [Chondrinema litorale]|uniref:plasmid transfer protein n=1 Tax=Chondrinema litorale TaxID=2994555 RepID=UPI0025427AB0|nr:plasmid transfer protein [Chondrinema litorale]UZS00017.1 plasmid transfer protein [Chondrinema litorale]